MYSTAQVATTTRAALIVTQTLKIVKDCAEITAETGATYTGD